MDKQEMVSSCCGAPYHVEVKKIPHIRLDVMMDVEVRYCDKCGEVCLPVEPAQPELPKELPLVSKPHWSENMATSRAYIEGLEDQNDADQIILDKWVEACRIFEEGTETLVKISQERYQKGVKEGYKKGVEDNYNMGQIDLGRALKRIDELEAEIEVRGARIVDLEIAKEEALLSIRRLTTAVNQYEGQTDAEIASLKEQLAVFMDKIPGGEYCWITPNRDGMCPYQQGGMCFILQRELCWNREIAEYTKAPGCPVPAKEGEKP